MLPHGVVRDTGVWILRGEVRFCLGVVDAEVVGFCEDKACAD